MKCYQKLKTLSRVLKKRKHDSLSPVSGKTEMKFYLRKMYMIIT